MSVRPYKVLKFAIPLSLIGVSTGLYLLTATNAVWGWQINLLNLFTSAVVSVFVVRGVAEKSDVPTRRDLLTLVFGGIVLIVMASRLIYLCQHG